MVNNDIHDQAETLTFDQSGFEQANGTSAPRSFEQECEAVGRDSAAAKLRLDTSAPEPYQRAYRKYKGPVARQDYFVRKCLGCGSTPSSAE